MRTKLDSPHNKKKKEKRKKEKKIGFVYDEFRVIVGEFYVKLSNVSIEFIVLVIRKLEIRNRNFTND